MKQFLMVAAMVIGMAATAPAQTAQAAKGKKHHCTAACTKEKHAYAHGEKGHVCTDACKKAKA